MTLLQAAEWCGGKLTGIPNAESAVMTGVAMDTRELSPGELFLALPGTRVNGADFIPDAARLGACAALTSELDSDSKLNSGPHLKPGPHLESGSNIESGLNIESEPNIESGFNESEFNLDSFPRIVVSDPVLALAELARKWREKTAAPKVVAITGTNGKTTTREMAATVLRAHFGVESVLTPVRNFNNHLGVPLTILRLRESHRAAVLELGMNHAGEIAALTRIARPDIGVITNAGRGHLEGLGSVENVARAKGELIENLPPDGIAVLNADDSHFPLWREMAGNRRVYTFGFADSDSHCRNVIITTPDGEKLHGAFPLDVPRHMAANTMAACAALGELGVSDEVAGSALADFRGIPGRMEFKTAKGGATLIDDSYNANPDSVLAALDVLRNATGPKFAALADMLELGDDSKALHREAGKRVGMAGNISLLAFGDWAKSMVDAASESGCENARHFSDKTELIRELQRVDHPGATILVKGSRGMRMDEVARALTEGGN